MARTRKNQGKAKIWTKAKWKAFMNVRLNSQEKAMVKENLLSGEDAFQSIMDMASAGYKVSLSYSIPEDVYTFSITGQYNQKANAGLTVSQRHRDAVVAVTAVWWCLHEDGYGQDWEERFGELNNDDW